MSLDYRSIDDPLHPLHWAVKGSGSVTTRSRDCHHFGCKFGHTEACYDYGNKKMMDYGAYQYRRLKGTRDELQAIKLGCFNTDEADKAKAYMAERHPDVPFIATYLTWPHLAK